KRAHHISSHVSPLTKPWYRRRRMNWEPLENRNDLPGRVEDWLAEPGSLTARVRSRCPDDFRLRVIDQRHEENVAVFDDRPASKVFCREITLGCGERPLVFARTRIPEATLLAHPWLGEL